MSKLTIIDKPEQIVDLIEYLYDKDFVAFDIETTGLTAQDEIIGYSVCASEEEAFYIILAEFVSETNKLKYSEVNITQTKRLLESLKTKKLLMHNSVFDCFMVESYFKIKLMPSVHTDTMILAHLLDENRRVGLKELAKDLFGEDSTKEQAEVRKSALDNGAKLTKDTYELYKANSEVLAKYGAKDALLTYKLFLTLVPELFEQKLDKFFYEDESMPLLKGPTYDLNTTGLMVDTNRLFTLKKTLQAECAEIKHFISQEIHNYIKDKYPGTNKKNTFNIESNQQLSWLLFSTFGLLFSKLTDGGRAVARHLQINPYTVSGKKAFIDICLKSVGEIYQPEAVVNGKTIKAKKIKEPWGYIMVDKRTLMEFADKYEWIKRFLDYKRKMKILNTYVEGIEHRMTYGVIKPSYLQHGTTSGRYASRNPNFQNLPRDDKRVKDFIIPRPGRVFVGADYSQLEPRVFASFSKDSRLLKAFEDEDDFYSVIGMNVYEKLDCIPRKDGSPDAFGIKYSKLRKTSKEIALAATYGATAQRLAPLTGKSIDETQQDIDNYFQEFQGVKSFQLESHSQVKRNGYVENLFGRKRRMPNAKKIDRIYGDRPHEDYPYEIRNILNLSVNHRVQSTGASIVNRAAIRFWQNCQELQLDAKIVCQVHDSIVIECNKKDAEIITILLQNAMESTVELPGVKLEAIPAVGNSLAEV